jgi:hypothetical protein
MQNATVKRLFGAGLLWMALTGCDALTGSTERKEARVEVTPLGEEGSLSMVTSTSFSVGGDRVLLIESDTQVVALPSTHIIPLDDQRRFFVSVGPAVEGDTTTVQMEVWIDDAPWFLEQRTLGVDSIGTMTFVYRFSQPIL